MLVADVLDPTSPTPRGGTAMNDSTDLFQLELDDNQTQRDGRTITGVIIRTILALSTGGFFYAYGGALFSWLVGPELGAWAAAIIGIFLVDVLAWRWSKIKLASTTQAQITIAGIMSTVDLALSAVITLLFVALMGDFITVSAEWLPVLQFIGYAVGAGAIVINGVAWHRYEATGAEEQEAQRRAELRAMHAAAAHVIATETAQATLTQTVGAIRADLPTNAATKGAQNAQAHNDRVFTARPTTAHLNGQKRAVEGENA